MSNARKPRSSLRLRLTLTYALLFLVGGIALIAITYLLMRHSQQFVLIRMPPPPDASFPPEPRWHQMAENVRISAERQRRTDLDLFLLWAALALGITTAAAGAAGWFLAGRALRPLRAMTDTAKEISQHNLHQRLDLSGPRDEVRDLAETINDLLARIQAAFDAQRRFVANASHELRTPLTWDRTLIEVTLADPDADEASLRSVLNELLASSEDKERLIEALLTLATSERGLNATCHVDFAETVTEALARAEPAAVAAGLTISSRIENAAIEGNPALARRLVDNLLDNAICHNLDGGRMEVDLKAAGDRLRLSIANTGPELTTAELAQIVEPFRRLDTRLSGGRGHGLGLSIVQVITAAHDGTLTLVRREGGGLTATVEMPRSGH